MIAYCDKTMRDLLVKLLDQSVGAGLYAVEQGMS
jgi:hypothetical protein